MAEISAGGGTDSTPTLAAPKGRDAARFALVCAQLLLVLAAIYQYKLESRTFFQVMLLAAAGFVVHALLPLAWRLPFFVGLSFASIVLAFGWLDGGWLIALGLVLIAICHLPWRLSLRVALLLATGALFAAWRVEWLPAPWSVAIWPILGAMFMFRIALYLHALRHDEKQPTPARTLAYFFMLPNVCFPLYPVVDYLTMRRTYFDREAIATYQTGVKWIVRGLVHLILYRLVYVHLAGDPLELRSLGDLVQFLLATFLLYLRVSGQFHLICGVLHLFGFRLPETHHLYFLSSSFTDFWRRINIYWKDFMMKLVYYPSFFALKRWGAQVALVGATLVVFAGTWLLHSYQWFWLRGGFPLEPQDGLFWGILGALVVMGALRELKRSRRRKLGAAQGWSLSLAARTVGTFTAICVLWSLWSAESVMTWIVMWSAAGRTTALELAGLAVLLGAGLAVAGRVWQLDGEAKGGAADPWGPALLPALTLLLLLALGATAAYAPIAPRLSEFVATLQQSTLNARDAALQHKGYYEKLDNVGRQSAQLWGLTAQKPGHWIHLGDTAAYRVRKDFTAGELVPGARIVFNDQPLGVNTLGMRDRERTLAKPAGGVRIAVVGPSHVMGSGVADEDTFTRLLERRLSAAGAGHVEVLNFGVAARALSQQLAVLDDQVLRFAPDVVLITDNPPRIAQTTVQHLLLTIGRGYDIPAPRLRALLERTGTLSLGAPGVAIPFDALRSLAGQVGVAARMPWAEADLRLRRAADEVTATLFQEIADRVRRAGAVPVFVALGTTNDPPGDHAPTLQAARAAGMPVFDLLDVWVGHDPTHLRVAPWDNHPNAAGNALIAERLEALLRAHAAELGIERAWR
jgi:hypothetical protein